MRYVLSVAKRSVPAVLAGLVIATGVWAQGVPSANDPVLVKTDKVEVRKSDYEAALLTVPEESRAEFAQNNANVIRLLADVLRNKTLAAQAQAAGLEKTPTGAAWLKWSTTVAYAQLQRDRNDKETEKAFEAKKADFEARSREIYTVDKKNYVKPAEVKASHILFSAKKYTPGEGQKRAMEVRQQLLDGADFSAAVKKEAENDDHARRSELGWFTADQMVPEFSKAAFALEKEGDISEPVQTVFGWHLIRLEGKKEATPMTYDEAKPIIMEDLKQKFLTEQRQKTALAIDDDPSVTLNKEAIDTLFANPAAPQAVEEQLKKSLGEK